MDGAPSRVLHIRKLPGEVTETEVIALGLPFGKVTNILMLKGKNQVKGFRGHRASGSPLLGGWEWVTPRDSRVGGRKLLLGTWQRRSGCAGGASGEPCPGLAKGGLQFSERTGASWL